MKIRRVARWLIGGTAAAVLVLATSGIALAQYPGGNPPPPTVAGEQFHRGVHLTKTGSNVMLYVLIAVTAVLVGAALRLYTRSRTAHAGD